MTNAETCNLCYYDLIYRVTGILIFTSISQTDIFAALHYKTPDQRYNNPHRATWPSNNDFSLIAPPLLLAEAESAINLKRLRREITRKELAAARAGLAALNIEIIHLPQTHESARNIVDSLRLPRVYDATFAALSFR